MNLRPFAFGLALVAGCSAQKTVPGLPTCTDPFSSYMPPTLALPNSGATGVPTNVGTLYVADLTGLGTNYTLAGGGRTLQLGNPIAIASPYPAALVPLQAYSYGAIAVPRLASATTYTLGTTIDYNLDYCTAVRHYTFGTFTTQ